MAVNLLDSLLIREHSTEFFGRQRAGVNCQKLPRRLMLRTLLEFRPDVTHWAGLKKRQKLSVTVTGES